MKETRRTRRIAELIKRKIARVIQEEIRDPRVRFVTVARAKVSADLRHATVHVSVMGTPQKKKSAMIALERSSGYFRGRIGDDLELRFVPEIRFVLDESVDRAIRIGELLDSVRPPAPEGEADETDAP